MPEQTQAATGNHTSLPWRAGIFDNTISVSGRCDVVDCAVFGAIVECLDTEQADEDGRVWTCGGDRGANRDYIVRACNAYPAYYAACEWIEALLLEIGADLANVRDVPISSLMLTQLMEAHAAAKAGGQP